jgi:hypothetical protein
MQMRNFRVALASMKADSRPDRRRRDSRISRAGPTSASALRGLPQNVRDCRTCLSVYRAMPVFAPFCGASRVDKLHSMPNQPVLWPDRFP